MDSKHNHTVYLFTPATVSIFSCQMADTSANITSEMAQTSLHPSARRRSNQEKEFIAQFGAVLDQLKVDNIASLALSVRQKMRARDNIEQTDPFPVTEAPLIGCKVNSEPLCGSYNLAYRVLFDDGVEWILKVPANGSHDRFDQLAADSMTSEAFTMKLIKRSTSIPVPTVHSFDVSSKNEIGCPYILMDFLKGRPLHEGWFNRGFSKVKREQFRARALQTTAAAMVQLNVFTLHRGGALRFDSAGQPVDVTGAKMMDATAYEGCGDEGPQPEHDTWCENVSTSDPSSYFLFMLNRRGHKMGDSPYSRGVHESTRFFTKWALEVFENVNRSEGQFVLVHPDFDLQNILVHDDGTLAGILDWDGVAAVPLTVGCLRYPEWLIRDCEPVSYMGNTPDDLVHYRAMYAQCIEALLPSDPANGKTGKLGADITRMSLITGTLQTAVNWPEGIVPMIGSLYREIERLIGQEDDSNLSETESLGSNVRPDLGVSDDSDADARLARTKAEDTSSDGETERTEAEETSSGLSGESKGTHPERLGQECVANMHQSSPEAFDDRQDGTDPSAMDVTSREAPELDKDSLELPACFLDLAQEAAHDQKAPTSQKDGVPQSALGLGEKGSEGMTNVLHQKEATEVKPSRKVRVVKWVLSLGEKGFREASKALHKQDKASGQQMKDQAVLTSAPNDFSVYSRTGKGTECLCNQAETLLRKIAARMHRDSEDSTPVETKTKRVLFFLESLIAMLKAIIWRLIGNGVEVAETPAAAKGRIPQKTVLVDTAHCQRCNPGKVSPGQEIANQEDESAGIKTEDVWAGIAAEVAKDGITIDMIKKRRDVIAQCVIENMRGEIEREKEDELHWKNKEEDRKADEVRKQTKLTNTKPASNADPVQHPALTKSKLIKPASFETRVAETEAAQVETPKEWAIDAASAKADTKHRDNASSLAGVNEAVSEVVERRRSGNPESQIAVCPNSSIEAPGHPDLDAVDPDYIRSYNNDSGFSEPESLISKLEAAKQRFDMKMALKGQKSASARLGPMNDGAEMAHLGGFKEKSSATNVATPEAVEEANQKLRMILESLAASHVSRTSLGSTFFQVAENDGATTVRLGIPKSRASKNDALTSGAVHLANQKLKTILSSLQQPVAVDANLQPFIYNIAESEDEESENVAAQSQTVVKGGRWFETPKGSLRRIEVGQKVNDSVNGQEAVANSGRCFPDTSRASPETSVISNGNQGEELAKGSDFQLLFPNPNQSETVNVFRVPDIDEDATDDDEEHNVERVTQDGNGEEGDELEEGEIFEEGVSLPNMVQGGVQGDTAKRVSAGCEASGSSGPTETVDYGNFNMEEICVALGNGSLDQRRMRRLEKGFKMMIAEALGMI